MNRKTKLLVAGGVMAVAAGIGGTAAYAATTGDDPAETPITGSDLERASEAALSHLGEGRVTEAETGESGSAYEVEVQLAEGRQVEVQLDAEFGVIGVEDEDRGEDS